MIKKNNKKITLALLMIAPLSSYGGVDPQDKSAFESSSDGEWPALDDPGVQQRGQGEPRVTSLKDQENLLSPRLDALSAQAGLVILDDDDLLLSPTSRSQEKRDHFDADEDFIIPTAPIARPHQNFIIPTAPTRPHHIIKSSSTDSNGVISDDSRGIAISDNRSECSSESEYSSESDDDWPMIFSEFCKNYEKYRQEDLNALKRLSDSEEKTVWQNKISNLSYEKEGVSLETFTSAMEWVRDTNRSAFESGSEGGDDVQQDLAIQPPAQEDQRHAQPTQQKKLDRVLENLRTDPRLPSVKNDGERMTRSMTRKVTQQKKLARVLENLRTELRLPSVKNDGERMTRSMTRKVGQNQDGPQVRRSSRIANKDKGDDL